MRLPDDVVFLPNFIVIDRTIIDKISWPLRVVIQDRVQNPTQVVNLAICRAVAARL